MIKGDVVKLSVSTNFQDDFIEVVKKYPVNEVYGKLTADLIGGGRPSFMLPAIGRKRIRVFIKELHEEGIKFNYLLNSTCLNNQELTKRGYNKIRRYLDWISKIEADAITVATPYLTEIIKRYYPQFKLNISAFAGVRVLQQAKYWEELGADVITLEPQTVNREFEIIKNISNNISAELQVIVNQGCLYSCPNVQYHANLFSHASQSKHYLGGFIIDYCAMKCKYLKLKEKVNFIRSDWIRPEDIGEYESIGVKYFKIIQRNWTTTRLEKAIKAYTEKKYTGNLADLIEFLFGENAFLSFQRKIKYFFRPFDINLFELWKLYRNINSLTNYIEIDNNLLEGFIEIFKKESCQMKDCEECRYCHNVAKRVVKIKEEGDVKKIKQNLQWLIDRKTVKEA